MIRIGKIVGERTSTRCATARKRRAFCRSYFQAEARTSDRPTHDAGRHRRESAHRRYGIARARVRRGHALRCRHRGLHRAQGRGGRVRDLLSNGTAKKARVKAKNNGKLYLASVTNAANLHDALSNLVQGIQTATYINAAGTPTPLVDASGKIALALTQLNNLLDGSE